MIDEGTSISEYLVFPFVVQERKSSREGSTVPYQSRPSKHTTWIWPKVRDFYYKKMKRRKGKHEGRASRVPTSRQVDLTVDLITLTKSEAVLAPTFVSSCSPGTVPLREKPQERFLPFSSFSCLSFFSSLEDRARLSFSERRKRRKKEKKT